MAYKPNAKEIVKDVEEIIMKRLGLTEKPGVAICFTCEPDFDECHWATNIPRKDSINLFQATANKMIAQTN